MDLALTAAATFLVGLSAGLFFTYANSVLPGLRETSDSVFVEAMTAMNRAILNPVFYLVFLGPVLAIAAATVASFLAGHHAAAVGCVIAGAVYIIGVLVPTMSVNVPLNNTLETTRSRKSFERRWVTWNRLRTVGAAASFVSLIAALAVGFA